MSRPRKSKVTPQERRLEREVDELEDRNSALSRASIDLLQQVAEGEKARKKLAQQYNQRGRQVLAAAEIIRTFSGKRFCDPHGEEATIPLRVIADLLTPPKDE